MPSKLVAVTLLGSLVVAMPTATAAWPGPVHEQTARLGVLLMPPTLRAQLEKQIDQLVLGATSLDSVSAAEHHRLHLDGSGGSLHTDAALKAVQITEMIRNQASFADVARSFGELSHLVADACYPLNTSESDERERQFYADFGDYVASKQAKFPKVFNGYVNTESFDVKNYVQQNAEMSNRSYPLIGAAYFPKPDGPMRSSATFDDRDAVFAIAQLSFTRAVSATANVWLHVWRSAHGDMANTPHQVSASEAGGTRAEDTSRAAQRQ